MEEERLTDALELCRGLGAVACAPIALANLGHRSTRLLATPPHWDGRRSSPGQATAYRSAPLSAGRAPSCDERQSFVIRASPCKNRTTQRQNCLKRPQHVRRCASMNCAED